MKLIITRHGETEENYKNICQGHTHGTLSSEGVKQAKLLANRLKNEEIDAIYSSDLARAKDTALAIKQFHDVEIKYDKRLRERYFGHYQGQSLPNNFDWENLDQDVESDEAFIKRVNEFIEEIKYNHGNETVLVVSHGGTNVTFASILLNKSFKDIGIYSTFKNTAVSIFEIKDNNINKISVNDASHLNNQS